MKEWIVEADFQGPGDSRIARWVLHVEAEDKEGARELALDAVPDAQIVSISEAE
jgi:hypothetical protein